MDSKNEVLFYFVVFLCTIALSPVICSGEEYNPSRATYYGSPDCKGTPNGACGFDEYGRIINDGKVTAVSSRLYKGGAGCGACYQVKCKVPGLCTEEGTQVVVTDYGEGDRTDFILSKAAYKNMAPPYMAEKLLAFGVVDVLFKRVPCQYSHDLTIKVKEQSNYHGYLAIVPLFQSGAYDITAMEIWQDDYKKWRPMRRAYGAVFDITNPPSGAITLRFQKSVNGYGDSKSWVQLKKVLPSDWKPGYSYDTGISA